MLCPEFNKHRVNMHTDTAFNTMA